MNKVTVISVYYNREACVKKSIESVINQLNDIHELILIDDGSTDNTLSELKKFSSYNKVSVISQKNIGFTKSIKKAVEISEGDYIAIHGSGDISNEKRFKKQQSILNQYNDVTIVGSKTATAYSDGSKGDEVVGDFFYGCAKEFMAKGNMFSHGEVMYRKSAYLKVGGYREYFEYAQDKDLWCRLSTIGNFYKINEILYTKYKNRDGSVSGTISKLYKQQMLSAYAEYLHIRSGLNYLNNNVDIYNLLEFKLSHRQLFRFCKIYSMLKLNSVSKNVDVFKPKNLAYTFLSFFFVIYLKFKRLI